jgi:hypothetical protein
MKTMIILLLILIYSEGEIKKMTNRERANGLAVASKQALDDAERRGQEKMRERAARLTEDHCCDDKCNPEPGGCYQCDTALTKSIRALPLEGDEPDDDEI